MHSPAAVLPAFFALDRYCRRRSDDACAAHLLGLVYERLEHLVPALSSVTKAINVLEAAYELTEDAFLEQPFAIANASAGRIALSQGNYDRALEAFGSAQGLLPEETDTADSDMIRLRALCQFGSGLARLKLGQSGEALGLLEEAIVTVKDDVEAHTQITVLFAQALWSLGTEDARESAKSQLLQWYVWPRAHAITISLSVTHPL
jgi:superkiller protein 3